MAVNIITAHGDVVCCPAVEDGVTLDWSRRGSPGRLRFNAVNDGLLHISEGDPVRLSVDGTDMFYGFVFTKDTDSGSSHLIGVTAYDQLRYFKNKDTYNFADKTADEIVAMLAADFRLRTGALSPTGYRIASLPEDDAALFDMVGDALDETLRATGRLYVLYDDAGRLTLRDVEDMKTDILIDRDTAGVYSYTSSIDTGTYDQIKISYNDLSGGRRSIFIAKNSAHINEWGLLQYTDTVELADSGAAKADALLRLYDRKTRKLRISDARGDVRVRAGSSVICRFALDDIGVSSYLMVEKVTHTFSGSEHTMSLELRGGTFGT